MDATSQGIDKSKSSQTETKTLTITRPRVHLHPEAIESNGEPQIRWLSTVEVRTSGDTSMIYQSQHPNLSKFFTKVAEDNADLVGIGKEESEAFRRESQDPGCTADSLKAQTRALQQRYMSFLQANGYELLGRPMHEARKGHFRSSYKIQGYCTEDNVDLSDDPEWIDVGEMEGFQIRMPWPKSITFASC